MKTTILCDRESRAFGGIDVALQVQSAVQETGSEARLIELNGDELNPCFGCFHCWVKTPGLCIQTNDKANTIAGFQMQSDVLIILSKITYGGYSCDIKSFLDRSIPNLSPFFENVNGEMHHKMRYERFPVTISIGYGDYTEQEYGTFKKLAERNALNMRPPEHFVFAIKNPGETGGVMQELRGFYKKETSL